MSQGYLAGAVGGLNTIYFYLPLKFIAAQVASRTPRVIVVIPRHYCSSRQESARPMGNIQKRTTLFAVSRTPWGILLEHRTLQRPASNPITHTPRMHAKLHRVDSTILCHKKGKQTGGSVKCRENTENTCMQRVALRPVPQGFRDKPSVIHRQVTCGLEPQRRSACR